MGDASYSAPDLWSIQDGQKPEKMEVYHIGQNFTKLDEHCAASIEKENSLEPSSEVSAGGSSSSEPRSGLPSQQNGDHGGIEDSETRSERFKPQKDSEASQSDVSSLDEGAISLNTHEAREEGSNGAEPKNSDLLHKNTQEGMGELISEETGADAPGNTNSTPELSRNLESPSKTGCPAVNQGHPFCFPDSLNTWVGGTKEGGSVVSSSTSTVSSNSSNVVWDGDSKEDGNVACSNNPAYNNMIMEDGSGLCRAALNDGEKIEDICLEEKDGFGREVERLDESLTPCVSSDISTENSSKDDIQPPLVPTANGNREHKNGVTGELGRDLQALPSLASTPESEAHVVFRNELYQSFDTSKQEWLDEGTSIISTDIEGWHRFDAEEVITNIDHTHGTVQRLELWEKLLDDGLDGIEKDTQTSPLQFALTTPPYKDEQFELASPGNPFIEGLERVSSFSEADGFVRNGDLPAVRLSQSFKESSSLRWEEAPFHAVGGNDDYSSESQKNAAQLEFPNEQARTMHRQPPPFKKPSSSFDYMEPFEAPSFMSLVDPKSQALFEASMPTYQASSAGHGQANGGDKWVANFDLMAPSMQEITRSLSLPRSGSEARDQRPGYSFSFATARGEEPSKKESQSQRQSKSGLSPKLSPLVQKVVDKVRTTPVVANGVINTVRQAMSPKVSDKKSSSKSMLACCICW